MGNLRIQRCFFSSCVTAIGNRTAFVFYILLGSGFSFWAAAEDKNGNIEAINLPTAALTLHNRSGYIMTSSVWGNGVDCSQRILFEPELNINDSNHPVLTVPAAQPIAVGVAIYAIGDKLPVVCDYILSFSLIPSEQYMLEYDVHDRRCYGQLFHQQEEKYTLVIEGGTEKFMERFPEFGWDQFEPGCMME